MIRVQSHIHGDAAQVGRGLGERLAPVFVSPRHDRRELHVVAADLQDGEVAVRKRLDHQQVEPFRDAHAQPRYVRDDLRAFPEVLPQQNPQRHSAEREADKADQKRSDSHAPSSRARPGVSRISAASRPPERGADAGAPCLHRSSPGNPFTLNESPRHEDGPA